MADVAFDTLFWFAAAPVMVGGLTTAWHTRPTTLRAAAGCTVVLVIMWHACLTLQRVMQLQEPLVPITLPWQLELLSIGMGVTLSVYGFSHPRAVLPALLGCIGVMIFAGHGLVLIGMSDCYHLC